MADEDVRDFQKAKQKACLRLGVATHQSIPTNREVEDALEEQLSLFTKDRPALHRQYLQTAFEIMNLVAAYAPKLTGAALSGVIISSRPVEIHLFSSTYEEICDLLDESAVDYRQIEKRRRFAGRRFANVPGFELTSTEVDVELYSFLPQMPYPPLNSISGQPTKGVSLKKVRRLLGHHSSS